MTTMGYLKKKIIQIIYYVVIIIVFIYLQQKTKLNTEFFRKYSLFPFIEL